MNDPRGRVRNLGATLEVHLRFRRALVVTAPPDFPEVGTSYLGINAACISQVFKRLTFLTIRTRATARR